MVVQHVSDVARVAVQVEGLGDLLLLLCIVECHDGKDWLDVEVKPAQRGRGGEEKASGVEVVREHAKECVR